LIETRTSAGRWSPRRDKPPQSVTAQPRGVVEDVHVGIAMGASDEMVLTICARRRADAVMPTLSDATR
jgi:hypothetical protein